jgi:hypothetical protein
MVLQHPRFPPFDSSAKAARAMAAGRVRGKVIGLPAEALLVRRREGLRLCKGDRPVAPTPPPFISERGSFAKMDTSTFNPFFGQK